MSYNEPPLNESVIRDGREPATSGRAIAAMVSGLVGLLSLVVTLFAVASVIAIFLGAWARRDIIAANGQLAGKRMATIGIALGAFEMAMFLLLVVLVARGTLTVEQ